MAVGKRTLLVELKDLSDSTGGPTYLDMLAEDLDQCLKGMNMRVVSLREIKLEERTNAQEKTSVPVKKG